jgi:RNA polymerase sigma factor (sigma-70 family)
MSGDTTLVLQRCLDRLNAGDGEARKDLLNAACERLNRLARKMFHAESRLQQLHDTDDVFQGAMVRLCRALGDVTPTTLREFFRLAALQIRRELIDLARHYYGPAGAAVRQRSLTPPGKGDRAPSCMVPEPPDSSLNPSNLAMWSEFHEQISCLPEEEREIFDLLWYQGLTHAQAAKLLQLSTKTIQRRWQAACLRLHEALHGNLPGL